MYQTGQLELRSAALLREHTCDRPSFEATIRRGWGGPRQFQIFVMRQGLLFLERHDRKESTQFEGARGTAIACMVLGGAIGGLIAASIAKPKTVAAKRETELDAKSDEDLLALAGMRRRSFVAAKEEVLSISIDPPGGWDRTFGHRTLAGWVTVEAISTGKATLEIRDQAALSVAVEALPRRYGERVRVNVEFDERRKKFVARR